MDCPSDYLWQNDAEQLNYAKFALSRNTRVYAWVEWNKVTSYTRAHTGNQCEWEI